LSKKSFSNTSAFGRELGRRVVRLGPDHPGSQPNQPAASFVAKGRSVGKRDFWQNVEYEHLAIDCMPCTGILSGFMHLFLVHAFHSCFLGINFFAKCARLPSTFHSTSIELPFGHQNCTWPKSHFWGRNFHFDDSSILVFVDLGGFGRN
jgi:hypothetical protein